jgi:pimeloyl-ACP methyl ester carboxylesterase
MELFFRQYGSGPPLVILHGLFGSSDNWVTIAKQLANEFTVILPDQRNHGNSPHSERHDYELMREDLYELVTNLSIEKFFLAGHSMGGKTAIAFALKWPEMLNGLLVADISPFKGDNIDHSEYNMQLTVLQAILSIDLSKINTRAEVDAELIRKGLPEYIRGFILKNLKRDESSAFLWKLNAQSLLDNFGEIMKPIDRNEALSSQVSGFPVIFLKGEKSGYLPESDYADIRKIFPAADFEEIKGAGHWVHADNPAEVIRNIRRLAH